MFENYILVTRNQYEAAFSTINRCIQSCDNERWTQPVVNLSFSQATFHALFYADFYLHETHDDSLKEQEFHRSNKGSFKDYEELLDRKQEYHYEKQFVEDYLTHCRKKMDETFRNANEAWLLEPSPFSWIPTTRSEVHLYNIRHIQHHAAQLIMALRQDGQTDLPWFRSGWIN